MAENSNIEWTHHTFNPWIGCTRVSPACDHCYAEAYDNRYNGGKHWGAKAERRRTGQKNWNEPLKWDKLAAAAGVRHRVFCASLADVFDNAVDDQWRTDLWALIRATPNLDWLLLTKRPQNIKKMLPPDWGAGYVNVWLGTTVENQIEAFRRIPYLLEAPAVVHFLSCEPLLGAVDLTPFISCPECEGTGAPPGRDETGWYNRPCLTCNGTGRATQHSEQVYAKRGAFKGISWVIVGGESGPDFRPAKQEWFTGLRDQCIRYGVPFLFKQHSGRSQVEIKKLGRELDGVVHNGYPIPGRCKYPPIIHTN